MQKNKKFIYISKFFVTMIFLLILSACGENSKTTPVQQTKLKIKNTSQIPKTKILNDDEFAASFAKTKYKNSSQSKDTTIKNYPKPFEIDPLGKSSFNNSKYRKNQTPFGSLAARLIPKHNFSWQPKWHYSEKGGVFLPSVTLSPDKSILGILETIPVANNKKTSLLVLINTYTWQIARIYYFEKNNYTKLIIPNKGKNLILWEATLSNSDKKYSLSVINSVTGEIKCNYSNFNSPLESIAFINKYKRIILKLKNDSNIYTFDFPKLDNLTKKDLKLPQSIIKVHNENILFISNKAITRYTIDLKNIIVEWNNLLDTIPDNFIFLENNTSSFAYSAFMNKTILHLKGKNKVLTQISGKVLTYRKGTNSLVFEEMKNNKINFLNLSDFSESKELIPTKIHPKTFAGAYFMAFLPSIKNYLILDKQGTLCLYHQNGTKWIKHIIFNAVK
jgi:hypothetical protein